MISPRLVFAPLLMAGLALSACGNSPELRAAGFSEMAPDLRALASRRSASAAPLQPTPGFPGLDPALVAGQTVPMMGAYLEDRQALAGLVAVETNGGVVSWRTADNIGLSMSQSGLLIATRGLGGDLHAADISQTAALIASGQSGTVRRSHVYLDGVYRPVPVDLTCTITPAGTETLVLNNRSLRTIRFDETCRNGDTTVTNRYWRDATGPLIRQSSQWVGPGVGVVHLQRLIE
jgi:hypothetical protein